MVAELYNDALLAFQEIPEIRGYLTYERVMERIDRYEECKAEYKKFISLMKQKAEKAFTGDVNDLIIELEAEIKTLKQERQELEGKYAERQVDVQSNKDRTFARAFATRGRNQIKRDIKTIDSAIIRTQDYISELKQYRNTTDGRKRRIAALKRAKEKELVDRKARREGREAIRRAQNRWDDIIEREESYLADML
jgi:hypothetical protein